MIKPDKHGYYGDFGGAYVPEMLFPNIEELQQAFQQIVMSPEFNREFRDLLRNYAGRPSALYPAKNLSKEHGYNVYLKREDLNHTGSHKINNVLGQILLADKLGKKRIIAETGAGQHGVATATACALFGLPCVVYMGEIDTQRQSRNVQRMKMLGAEVVPVTSGSRVLKDATNEALRDWIANPHSTHYVIGSAVGPHPFPEMVSYFQSVISEELKQQFKEIAGNDNPDYVVACVGGGSNAIGGFYHYVKDDDVKLIGVEAAGQGVNTEYTAATIAVGSPGILHGSKTYLYQDSQGQVMEAHSISAGLDYPGIGPQHAYLHSIGRVKYGNVTDAEAIQAGKNLINKEGIIPALESAHALAYLNKIKLPGSANVVVILSGNGEKDLEAYK